MFLRKSGTNEIFGWTPTLAKRNDMQAIDDEDAAKCMELHNKEKLAKLGLNRANGASAAKSAAPESDLFATLDEDGVASKAVEFKIKLGTKLSLQQKRAKLRKIAAEIERASVMGSTSSPTTTPETAKTQVAPKAEPEGDAAPDKEE